MSFEPRIRPYRPGDETAVAQVAAECFDRFIRPLYSERGVRSFAAYIYPEAVAKRQSIDCRMFVADLDGEIAGLIEMIPPLVGLILMILLYAVYAADTIVTAFAASDLARDLDALERVADSMHAVSDAMTELLGWTRAACSSSWPLPRPATALPACPPVTPPT